MSALYCVNLKQLYLKDKNNNKKFISLLTKVNNEQPSPSNERFSLILLVNVDRRFSIFIATVEK
jgi:hypothetical protein